MKLLQVIAAMVTLASVVESAALPPAMNAEISRDVDVTAVERDNMWPEVAGAVAKRTTETNADRMKRGLGPAAPVTRTHQYVPRFSPAPPTSGSFTLLGCFQSISNDEGFPAVSGPSEEEAVEQCRALASTSYTTFTIAAAPSDPLTGRPPYFFCGGGIQYDYETTCTNDAYQYAVYSSEVRRR